MAGKEGSEEKLWLFGGLSPRIGEDEPKEEEAGKEEEASKDGPQDKLSMSRGLRQCRVRDKAAADLEADPEKLSMLGSLSLSRCTGSNKLEVAADVESGKPELRSGSRRAVEDAGNEKVAEEAVIKAKRKAEAAGGASDGGMDAAGANPTVEAASGDGGKEPAPERKFVEMPMSLLSWILSQERPTGPLNFPLLNPEENEEDRKLIEEINSHNQEREDMDDLFYEFQAWVRQQYNKNGRVMCPETFLRGPIPGLK